MKKDMSSNTMIRAILITIGINCVSELPANDELLARLKREGPPAWKKSDDEYDPVSGEFVLKIFAKEKGVVTPVRTRRYMFLRNGKNTRFDKFDKDLTKVKESMIVNADYAAQVMRSSNSQAFQATWIGTKSEGSKQLNADDYYTAYRSGTELIGKPLQEFLNHPKFRIHEIEEFEANGEPLVYLKYDCLAEDPEYRILGGTLTLAPGHGWKIVDSDHFYDSEKSGSLRLHNHFEFDAAGRSIIKYADYYTLYFKSGGEDHSLFEFSNISFAEPPESKFRLKDFGLPEPTTAMKANHASTVHLWFVAGGILMFAIAYGLNRAARQSA